MSINYSKYINSTSTHYIANSGSNERGKTTDIAYYTWIVHASGSVTSYHATTAYRPAPACVIW